MEVRFVSFTTVGDAAWNAFVRRHPHHAPGHLAETLRLEERQGASIDASVAIIDEQQRIVGICPVVEICDKRLRMMTWRARGSGTWFPSSPLVDMGGGERRSEDLLHALMHQVVETARRENIDRLSFSYPAVAEGRPAIEVVPFLPLRRSGFTDSNRVAQLLCLDGPDEVLFKGLDAKARNKVRRAESAGCVTELIGDADTWASTYPLYAETLGTLAMSRDVFTALYDAFITTGQAIAIQVRHADRIVNVVVISIVNGAAYYWLGFSDQHDAPAGANVLGLWCGITMAKARGARIFELGSLDFGDGKQERIAAFKKQFGGRPYAAFNGTLELSSGRHHFIEWTSHLIHQLRRRTLRRS